MYVLWKHYVVSLEQNYIQKKSIFLKIHLATVLGLDIDMKSGKGKEFADSLVE